MSGPAKYSVTGNSLTPGARMGVREQKRSGAGFEDESTGVSERLRDAADAV